jgi:hypothetical protein
MGIWKNNLLEGNVIIIEDDSIKKQYWQSGKASHILPIDTPIIFQKCAERFIFQNSRLTKSQKSENE